MWGLVSSRCTPATTTFSAPWRFFSHASSRRGFYVENGCAGLWLAIGHVTTAAALAVTIIGLPMAWANLKLIPVTLFPLGKQVVPSTTAFGTVAP